MSYKEGQLSYSTNNQSGIAEKHPRFFVIFPGNLKFYGGNYNYFVIFFVEFDRDGKKLLNLKEQAQLT